MTSEDGEHVSQFARCALSPMKGFIIVSAAIAVMSCGGGKPPVAEIPAAAPAAAERQYLLERVDDAAVVQLYADGFSALPLKEKSLIWHLYQAVIAGRDIFYDQRYVHNLVMRDVLEAIITHPEGVDPKTLE